MEESTQSAVVRAKIYAQSHMSSYEVPAIVRLDEEEIKKAEQILELLAGSSIYSAGRILESVGVAARFSTVI
ncbi:MAG: hypothetical protein FWC60_07285 [Firmicutes bacterium]|nr:hypothetical protein [Bacillota bacterium]